MYIMDIPLLNKYLDPITLLSKTDENFFIVDTTLMINWDALSKLINEKQPESVDAIYYYDDDTEPIIYFFEFKQLNLFDNYFDERKNFEKIIEKLENDNIPKEYIKKLRKIKKKLISKKVISLKLKPLESLITLHSLAKNNNISIERFINTKKKYYIISKTPQHLLNNKSKIHKNKRPKGLLDFMDKISPFPFHEAEPISEETFKSIIHTLEEKQNYKNQTRCICKLIGKHSFCN